jgi:hypothetical protein
VLSVDGQLADRVHAGFALSNRGVRNAARDAGLSEAQLRLTWRPVATLTVSGDIGATRPAGEATGHGRMRWRAADGATIVDLRAGHAPLAATPALLANRVVRTDVGATVERALAGRLRLRTTAQGASYAERTGVAAPSNGRTSLGGGPVVDLPGGMQMSLVGTRSRWRRPTSAGYFAPRHADLAEVGMYLERESAGPRPITVAVDAGAGVQRLEPFGAPAGAWGPAGRLWAQLAIPVGPVQLTPELDLFRSQLGGEAATSGRWSASSLSLGVRVPLR